MKHHKKHYQLGEEKQHHAYRPLIACKPPDPRTKSHQLPHQGFEVFQCLKLQPLKMLKPLV